MIWEEKTHIIVMVTNLHELGRVSCRLVAVSQWCHSPLPLPSCSPPPPPPPQTKCARYWPDPDSYFEVGELSISTVKQNTLPTFTKREFSVEHVSVQVT